MVTVVGMTCCDTSFLFALYATEIHTVAAVAEAQRVGARLTVSSLNEYELANALLLSAFRRLMSEEQAARCLGDFQTDLATGAVTLAPCDLTLVIKEAMRLSAGHTAVGGYRGFDILHVAAAACLGAEEFLSFDARQRELAAAAGLAVGPPT